MSLEESLQRKKFEWERQTSGNSTWLDHLVDRLHERYRNYQYSEEELANRARDLSRYVTTSKAYIFQDDVGNTTTSLALAAIVKVAGSLVLEVSEPHTFVQDPSVLEVVRASLGSAADVPTGYVTADMALLSADSNRTGVNYTIALPSSDEANATSVGATIDARLWEARQEITDLISGAIDSWLGAGVYDIFVLNISRPTLQVVSIAPGGGNGTSAATPSPK